MAEADTLSMGDHELRMGEDLRRLRPTDAEADPERLRSRLAADGYLLLRGVHDPDLVAEARGEVVDELDREGLLDPERPREEAPVGADRGLFLDGPSWERFPALHELVEGESIMAFFGEFLGARPFTFDYKWGRAKETGGFTGFHADRVFMGRGTDDLYTLWTPLGDVPAEMGPLLCCPGSQDHERLRETYAAMDVDRDVFEATFSSDPHDVAETLDCPLATADFEAGDALLFGPYFLHGSLSNATDRYRISVDTRYQSIEEGTDPRWVGDEPVAHYNWPSEDETPIEELRAEWGL